MNAVELLESLKKDLEFYNDSIKEVALEILDNDISKFPIFIAHQADIQLGEPLLDRNVYGTFWNIRVSIVQEFIKKKLINPKKSEDFRAVYKDPRKYMCVFLISEKGGNFIFHPYK